MIGGMDIKSFSREELTAELARREREEREARRDRNAARRERRAAALTPEVVAALAPDHERSSCSDLNRVNGWGSHSSGCPRCLRCALLEGTLPEGFHYSLQVEADL